MRDSGPAGRDDRIVDAIVASHAALEQKLDLLIDAIRRFESGVMGL